MASRWHLRQLSYEMKAIESERSLSIYALSLNVATLMLLLM